MMNIVAAAAAVASGEGLPPALYFVTKAGGDRLLAYMSAAIISLSILAIVSLLTAVMTGRARMSSGVGASPEDQGLVYAFQHGLVRRMSRSASITIEKRRESIRSIGGSNSSITTTMIPEENTTKTAERAPQAPEETDPYTTRLRRSKSEGEKLSPPSPPLVQGKKPKSSSRQTSAGRRRSNMKRSASGASGEEWFFAKFYYYMCLLWIHPSEPKDVERWLNVHRNQTENNVAYAMLVMAQYFALSRCDNDGYSESSKACDGCAEKAITALHLYTFFRVCHWLIYANAVRQPYRAWATLCFFLVLMFMLYNIFVTPSQILL